MDQQPAKKRRGPKSKFGKILVNLIVTAVVGFLYFYVALPAINLQSSDFYLFIGILCVVYVVCALVTSGFNLGGGGPKEYFKFIKSQCLPIGILFLALILVAIVGSVISLPIFRAGAYRDLLDVQDGDFSADVAQISFNEIPTLDRTSAEFLGDRQMGTLSDMVSQFEYSNDSTQINYQGRPVRVAPIDYADIIKWFTNRSEGLPAYVVVDMVTQEATVVRLSEGMKYSFSEVNHRKSVTVVEMLEKGDVRLHTVPLTAPHDMRTVEGMLSDVMAMPYSEDYVWVTIHDELPPPDARVTISTVFPNMLKFSVVNSKTKMDIDVLAREQMESKSIPELFSDFYRLQNNDVAPSERHIEMLTAILKELEGEVR